MARCFVFGHYGGSNTGDEAMLVGLLHGLAARGVDDVALLTKTGEMPEYPLPVNPSLVVGMSVRGVLAAVASSDVVLLGGGTHFHDDYESARYRRHLVYMLRLVTVTAAARFLGKKVYWLGMGFGPFYRRASRLVTGLGLRFVNGVSVRDSDSEELVKSLHGNCNVVVAFDLAAELAAIVDNALRDDRDWIGVSVTSVEASHMRRYHSDRFWAALLESFREALTTHNSVSLKFFVIRGGVRESDVVITTSFVASLERDFPDRVILIPYEKDPVKTFREMHSCRAFVATRYHSAILSYLAGCDLLLLSYHSKVTALAKELEIDERACLRVASDTNHARIREAVMALFSGEAYFRPILPVETARERTEHNFAIPALFGDPGHSGTQL